MRILFLLFFCSFDAQGLAMCVEATEEPRWDGFRGVWGFLPAIPLKIQDIHGFWM